MLALGLPARSGYEAVPPPPLPTPALSLYVVPLVMLRGMPVEKATIPDHCQPPKAVCMRPGFKERQIVHVADVQQVTLVEVGGSAVHGDVIGVYEIRSAVAIRCIVKGVTVGVGHAEAQRSNGPPRGELERVIDRGCLVLQASDVFYTVERTVRISRELTSRLQIYGYLAGICSAIDHTGYIRVANVLETGTVGIADRLAR